MWSSTTKTLIAASAAIFLGLTLPLGAPAHAESRTIVGQGTYVCQSAPRGVPPKTYDVTIRMSLSAPSSVAPGDTLTLAGNMTMQFPYEAYQEGKRYGVTEAEGYSNTLSVGTTLGGATSDVSANRWQTAPFPWRDPLVISAPISFQPITVPADAQGEMTITLPRNERRAENTASNNPTTVAFNAVATNKTSAGDVSENLGCFLQGSGPGVIGTIPISSSQSEGNPGASGQSAASSDPNGAATLDGPGSSGQSGGAPGRGASNAPSDGTATSAEDAIAAGTATDLHGGTGQAPYPSAAPPDGVYVPTNALLLGGGLVCAMALSYAALTNYRLRSIRRALEGS